MRRFLKDLRNEVRYFSLRDFYVTRTHGAVIIAIRSLKIRIGRGGVAVETAFLWN